VKNTQKVQFARFRHKKKKRKKKKSASKRIWNVLITESPFIIELALQALHKGNSNNSASSLKTNNFGQQLVGSNPTLGLVVCSGSEFKP